MDEIQEYQECYPDDSQDMEINPQDALATVNNMVNAASNLANNIVDVYAQCKEAEERSERMRVWGQVKMAETVAKFKSCQMFLDRVFGERDAALGKHYDLLDKAVATNDKDLIIAAIKGISTIVTKSPLEDLEAFAKVFNDESQPLLDF